MKLSNFVLVFAAVSEARKYHDVGSRWAKKIANQQSKDEKSEAAAIAKVAAKQAAAEEKKENKIESYQEKAAAQAEAKKAAYQEKKADQAEAKKEAAQEKKEAKVEAKQEKKENKAAAKQLVASMRSLSFNAKPSGFRRENRKETVNAKQEGRGDRQDGRAERQENRVENKLERVENKQGMRVDARIERLADKKADFAEAKAEKKDAKKEAKVAAINARQEVRADRGNPRPAGDRRNNRMEKLEAVKAAYAAKKAARMKAIQLAKTWKPCGADGSVSNAPWGSRKPGHMQLCMQSKGYQFDAMRCIIYGMRADHVDETCRNTCDDILADYDNLNNDMSACAASKQ